MRNRSTFFFSTPARWFPLSDTKAGTFNRIGNNQGTNWEE
jgi:hypothetical protein